jgi:hypothetical protein
MIAMSFKDSLTYSAGWELHVCFVKTTSLLDVYLVAADPLLCMPPVVQTITFAHRGR